MAVEGEVADQRERAIVTTAKNRWLTIAVVVVAVAAVILVFALFVFRPTVVPNFVGTVASEVASNVVEAGLQVGNLSQVATASVGADVVLEQYPAAGAEVPRRTSVDITSSVAPANATVPEVTGVSQEEAAQTLSGALFVPLNVDEFSDEVAAGTVMEQFPLADEEWMTGRPVALGVSVGPDDGTAVEVPELEGKTPEQAIAALAEVGLSGDGLIKDLGEAAANVAVVQLPEAGTLVRPGTTVLMLFVLP